MVGSSAKTKGEGGMTRWSLSLKNVRYFRRISFEVIASTIYKQSLASLERGRASTPAIIHDSKEMTNYEASKNKKETAETAPFLAQHNLGKENWD